MNTHRYRRRKFLAGLGLGAASPLLPSLSRTLVSEALGQESKRKRLFLCVDSNGLPDAFSRCQARGERDFDLAPMYQPLAAHKNRLTIMHRFFVPFSRDLHGSQKSTLTGVPCSDPRGRALPGGISIDRFIAKKIGGGDAFSSVAVGRSPNQSVSADGPNQPFPLIMSPAKAFSTFFGGNLPAAGPAMPGDFAGDFVSKDRSILDFLRADSARLHARLAAPERAKLDQYLESLRVLERQITTRASARSSCQKPPQPPGPPDPPLNEALTQLLDMSVSMHRCNLTHVTYFSFEGFEGPHIVYSWLNDPRNVHDDHHRNDTPILQRIATWKMSTVARLVNQLAETPEGSGTMLDSSLVVYLNTGGGMHHRGFDRHPVILVGGPAGSGGRYLDYPEGRHSLSEVFVSIAHMMGAPTDKFGDPRYCPGPLPGLA